MENLHTRSQVPRRDLPGLLAGRRRSSEKARPAAIDDPSQGTAWSRAVSRSMNR